MPIAQKRDIDDSLGVRLHLRDNRLFGLRRQLLANPANAITHIAGRSIRLGAKAKAHLYLAFLGTAARRDDLDAGDAGDGRFQNLRDLALDDLRARAGIGRADVDDRLIDIGIFADRQRTIGDEPGRRMKNSNMAPMFPSRF
jgi:hypothetical protein